MHAPTPEPARLKALRDYGILDTLPEGSYDDLVHLAAHICRTPVAAINFIDAERQWSKAQVGLDEVELPREVSLCAHAIMTPDELTVIPELRHDVRFSANPLVTGPSGLQFYPGAPLVTSAGEALGTLCVADRVSHALSPEQVHALAALARQVMTLLELRRTVQKLETSEGRFATFLDKGPAIAFVKDEAGRMVYVNKPFERRFGMTTDDWQGKNDFELWPEETARALRAHDELVLAGDATLELVETVPGADGELNYWQSYKFPLADAGRKLVAGMAVDITTMRRYELQLETQQLELERVNTLLATQSRTDTLTGLKNRRAFIERFETEIRRVQRHDEPLSLLMLDVDHFKGYNDTFGHPAGDQVLRQLATLLLEGVRSTDLVARYGGEEFVILLPDTNLEGARLLAERCRYRVELADWPERRVTVSIGVATLGVGTAAGNELLEAADRALYDAKRAGRNRVSGTLGDLPLET